MVFIALISMVAVQAQIKEDIAKSQKRAANLRALCASYPKQCGYANVDGYGKSVWDAADFAIKNSTLLEGLYKRQIGETIDGVTDVTVKKPTLDEWIELAATITAEGVSVKNAVDKAQSVAPEVKSIVESAGQEKNPLKAAKAAKGAKAASAILDFGNSATPILLEESAAQAKAVQEIIKTLKSGGNL